MQRSYLGKTLVATELPVHTFPYRVRSVLRCGGRHSHLPRKWQLIGLGAILFIVVLLLIISGSLGMLGHQTDGHGNWIGKFCDGDNGIIRAILRV